MKSAVITGDIIKSRNIKGKQRNILLNVLKKVFVEINEKILQEDIVPFEIYRGDSFQAIIKKPENALLVSLILRANLRSFKINSKNTIHNYCDARLAIGIGNIDYEAKKIIESDGEAFLSSGTLLDKMKKKDERLRIHTSSAEINNEFEVECSFADAIIGKWTKNQAEVIYFYLLEHETQKELAKRFNISQPALHKRLVDSGNIRSIDLFLNRFEKIIISLK